MTEPEDLLKWLTTVWPLISNRTVEKMKVSLSNCDAQIYWAGTVLRIDVKPKREEAT